MQSLLYEIKKMFLLQKGWLVLLCAMLCELGFLFLTATPYSSDMELYKDGYLILSNYACI